MAAIDPATGYKLCKRGHVRSPENVSKRGYCNECAKEYRKSDKYKECQKKYQQSGKTKEYMRKYRKSDKNKEAQKKYFQSKKGKECKAMVARLLGIKSAELTPELYEIKLLSLKLRRKLYENSECKSRRSTNHYRKSTGSDSQCHAQN